MVRGEIRGIGRERMGRDVRARMKRGDRSEVGLTGRGGALTPNNEGIGRRVVASYPPLRTESRGQYITYVGS